MKIIFIILLFILTTNAYSTPKKIEMIFLSPHKVSQLLKTLDKQLHSQTYSMTAEGTIDHCITMGDGCFHPQLGYIENKPNTAPVILKDEDIKLRTFNAIETNMINCDKGNYFDIYCGQAKNKIDNSEIEIWFDISSSLRGVDYNKDENFCNRRSFMSKVIEGCKDKVKVSIYNTVLKEVGDRSSVCLSYGTNDEKRLVQWMKDSQAKLLLIVTDIDEVSLSMRDFLDENGAKLIGDGVSPFTSADLLTYAKDFTKLCSKN